jgi:hypothetical protein
VREVFEEKNRLLFILRISSEELTMLILVPSPFSLEGFPLFCPCLGQLGERYPLYTSPSLRVADEPRPFRTRLSPVDWHLVPRL